MKNWTSSLATILVRLKKLLIEETKHMDFSDAPQFSNFAQRIGYAGKIPSVKLKQILNSETLNFFDTHIRGQISQ